MSLNVIESPEKIVVEINKEIVTGFGKWVWYFTIFLLIITVLAYPISFYMIFFQDIPLEKIVYGLYLLTGLLVILIFFALFGFKIDFFIEKNHVSKKFKIVWPYHFYPFFWNKTIEIDKPLTKIIGR